MAKIEFHTTHIDVGHKRADGTRKVIIEVDPYEHDKLMPILLLNEEYRLKVIIEDAPKKDEFEVKL